MPLLFVLVWLYGTFPVERRPMIVTRVVVTDEEREKHVRKGFDFDLIGVLATEYAPSGDSDGGGDGGGNGKEREERPPFVADLPSVAEVRLSGFLHELIWIVARCELVNRGVELEERVVSKGDQGEYTLELVWNRK